MANISLILEGILCALSPEASKAIYSSKISGNANPGTEYLSPGISESPTNPVKKP
jgi:hypothetical protein